MKTLEKISQFIGRYMAVIVLLVAALSLFVPKAAIWVRTEWINYLLMLVMFGMGLTLKVDDFRYILSHPKYIILGCVSQFTVMPLLAFGLGILFGLDTALLAGVILVGACPGGTVSNVITYLFLHKSVEVDAVSMFVSIIQVVIIPVVSHNAEKIMSTGIVVFAVAVLHNLIGYACGFGLGKLLKLDFSKTKALSVEIGMQNSGLATSLAGTTFPDLSMATVPGAVFSVWHNISGAVLANIYNRI